MRSHAVEFRALPTRAGPVRRIVCAQLRYWRLDPLLVDRAALAVSELLATVREQAGPGTRCTVELLLKGGLLTVSVRDDDPHPPPLRACGALATSGRGLALVAAASDSCGLRVRPDGPGKVAWFTLRCAAGDAAAAAPAAERQHTS